MVKHFLIYCVHWLETCHWVDRDRISILGDILRENTVVVCFKCPLVTRDRLFIYLVLTVEEKKFARLTAAEHNHDTQTKESEHRGTFLWQDRIKVLQFNNLWIINKMHFIVYYVLYPQCSHQHVSPGNTAIFRVILLKE